MTKQPVVSVVMLTYNHRPYVERAVDSVLSQTGDFLLEVIVADDCSTDGTAEILTKYAREHPDRVKLLSSPVNLGVIPNMMRALEACTGEYLAWCEGDDCWLGTGKVDRQLAVLTTHPEVDMCIHIALSGASDAEPAHLKRIGDHGPLERTIPAEEFFVNDGSFCPTASLLIRVDVLRPYFAALATYPVGDFFLQCLGSVRGGARYLPEELSFYRVSVPGSWSTSQATIDARYRHYLEFRDALQHFDQVTARRFSSELGRLRRHHARSVVLGALLAGNAKVVSKLSAELRQDIRGSTAISDALLNLAVRMPKLAVACIRLVRSLRRTPTP